MKSVLMTLGLAAGSAMAYPGLGAEGLSNIIKAVEKRDAPLNDTNIFPLPGDLATVGPTTATGELISDCLNGEVDCYQAVPGQSFKPEGKLGSAACNKDICCTFGFLGEKLTSMFVDEVGQCTQAARASTRLAFHDSAAWDMAAKIGGADGSIILNNVEVNASPNNGLQNITKTARALLAEFEPFGVGAADLVQFMGVMGILSCPGAVRMRFFAGRPSSAAVNNFNLTPLPTQDADTLIDNFNAKGIKPTEFTALLGAHTAGQQFTFNLSMVGSPFDPTPGIWDPSFFYQFTINGNAEGVLKLPSDLQIVNSPQTSAFWTHFADPANREDWNTFFAQGMLRIALAGVKSVNNLTDCTHVLPNQQNDTNEADFTKRYAKLQ